MPGLSILLGWSAAVDLDLYVTDPAWETLYFANNPTRAGARLVRDVSCRDVVDDRSFVEIAHVPTPAVGPYRIGVDFIDSCASSTEAVTFRVTARGSPDSTEHVNVADTITLERFLPVVLELAVTRDAEGDLILEHTGPPGPERLRP